MAFDAFRTAGSLVDGATWGCLLLGFDRQLQLLLADLECLGISRVIYILRVVSIGLRGHRIVLHRRESTLHVRCSSLQL